MADHTPPPIPQRRRIPRGSVATNPSAAAAAAHAGVHPSAAIAATPPPAFPKLFDASSLPVTTGNATYLIQGAGAAAESRIAAAAAVVAATATTATTATVTTVAADSSSSTLPAGASSLGDGAHTIGSTAAAMAAARAGRGPRAVDVVPEFDPQVLHDEAMRAKREVTLETCEQQAPVVTALRTATPFCSPITGSPPPRRPALVLAESAMRQLLQPSATANCLAATPLTAP